LNQTTVDDTKNNQNTNLNASAISITSNRNLNNTKGRFIIPERTHPQTTIGLYSRQQEGVADAEPKVMEPYIPIPERVPRKVEIDRKKKEYRAFDIGQLLERAGVYKDEEPSYLSWLHLDLFDDETFDDYSPQEWMDKTKVDGEEKGLALKGKGCINEAGRFTWNDVLITSYYEAEKEFICTLVRTNEKVRFKRIDLWFEIEDPKKFVERVKKAHLLRAEADSRVRYNFYIDNMPRQDVNAMDPEQKNRLLSNAIDTKMLKGQSRKANPNFEEELKTEASQEYERTMNKIIFDEYFEEANQSLISPYQMEIPEEEEQIVNNCGIITIPKRKDTVVNDEENYIYPGSRKFTDIFKDFCFSSLFIKKEVIIALQGIKESCREIGKREMFHMEFTEVQRIESFRQKQNGAISLLSNHLKDGWILEMTKMIKTRFNDVGKGWFNIKEANILTYEFGKLKRFLTVIRLMMQDTLYSMIKRSLFDFKEFLQSFIPEEVIVESESSVINKFKFKPSERFKKNINQPLLKIDLIRVSNQNEFNYSIRPQKIVEEMLSLVSNALKEMEVIPDLEPKILEDLFKARKNASYIMTPKLPKEEPRDPDPTEIPRRYPDENKWVWTLFGEFREIMEKAVDPLKQFTKIFDKYKVLIGLNADDYINKLENDENFKSAESLQVEIEKFAGEEQIVKKSIPEEILVSCFLIDCKELIRFLTGKYQDMNKRLIELMARRAREKCNQIAKQITDIQKEIRKNPNDIEELTNLKEYVTNELPNVLQKIKQETQKVIDVHAILESYEYRIRERTSTRNG
jgi:dynein heavy chain